MRTLAPAQTIFRVTDRLFPNAESKLAFLSTIPVFEDKRLNAGAILLYMILVQLADKAGCCCPTQTALTTACKMTIRSVKTHLRKLLQLGYIQIVSATEGAESCGR